MGVAKSFWVAEPRVYSAIDHIYYIRKLNDQMLVQPANALVIKDDGENPIMNTIRQSLLVKLPENTKRIDK